LGLLAWLAVGLLSELKAGLERQEAFEMKLKETSRLISATLFIAIIMLIFLSQSLGFMLVTAAVILLLTDSYEVNFWRKGVGAGWAYFGLAYAGFCLALLGIGMLQTHVGCMLQIGGCYQQGLPHY